MAPKLERLEGAELATTDGKSGAIVDVWPTSTRVSVSSVVTSRKNVTACGRGIHVAITLKLPSSRRFTRRDGSATGASDALAVIAADDIHAVPRLGR